MNDIYTTIQAAERLNTTHDALLNWLSRNPVYKPAMRLQSAYLWTVAEIEIVRHAKAQTATQAAHIVAKEKASTKANT